MALINPLPCGSVWHFALVRHNGIQVRGEIRSDLVVVLQYIPPTTLSQRFLNTGRIQLWLTWREHVICSYPPALII